MESDGSAVSAQSLLCLSPAPLDIMDGLLCICRHCTGPPAHNWILLLLEHYLVWRSGQDGHDKAWRGEGGSGRGHLFVRLHAITSGRVSRAGTPGGLGMNFSPSLSPYVQAWWPRNELLPFTLAPPVQVWWSRNELLPFAVAP